MARLLIASRSMALALRLADAHVVTEYPVDDVLSLEPGSDTDVIVLDLGDPAAAVQALDHLRENGHETPVLLVSGYQPEWTGLLGLDLPAVRVVPLPITRAALLSGITELVPPAEAPGEEPASTPDAKVPQQVGAAPGPSFDELVPPAPARHDPELAPGRDRVPDGDGASPAIRRPLIGRRSMPPAQPGDRVPAGRGSPRDLHLPDRVTMPPPGVSGGAAELTVDELVERLLERVSELFGVGDTAQVLSDEVVERADADAAAVIIPDDHLWRVAGGVGLRPLERRLVMDSSNWLVGETAIGGKALVIEDTDIVRPKLAGTPLAAWKHLLAVPVSDLRVAIILGRGGEAGPFSDRELKAVVGPAEEAAGLLRRAIQTRHLARLLGPLRDIDPTSARPR